MKIETLNEYVNGIYARNPKASYEGVVRLQKIAQSLHRIAEGDCMGRSEIGDKRARTRWNRLVKEAESIAESMGAKLYVQPDPRGWPLTLYFEGDTGWDNPRADGGWHGVGVPPR
jgi:hypothetical protein